MRTSGGTDHVSTNPPGGVQPYIPASVSLPEITVKAVVVGVVLSAVLAGANAYLGLKVGMTVSASIPAAVISMALLRMFRDHNILENNIVQTAASAGESLAAGVIFTLPALIMLGYWADFDFLATTGISLCGGILGVLFTIPLRRALILEADLMFPEGVATGEVLKAGTEGGKGVHLIAAAALAGAFFKLCQTGFKLAAERVTGAISAGGAIVGLGADLSVALLAVGYIVGLNIAMLVFGGGLISWFCGIPIYTFLATPERLNTLGEGATGYALAEAVWSARIRYMGVGAMATGGLWALISLMKPIRDGVRSSLHAVRQTRSGAETNLPRTDRDTPITRVVQLAAIMVMPLFVIFMIVVDQNTLGIADGRYWTTIAIGVLFAFVAGFLFSSIAGYMAGLVGSSNNPISGVTIATVLTVSLVLFAVLGTQLDFTIDADAARATAAAATAILVGAVVACAAAIAGDNMQDLKTGQIVGATPYKQQIMQMIGVVAGALVIAPVLSLLFQAYGLGNVFPRAGMNPSEALRAPQATLMASVAEGVFRRNLPWTMVWIGAGIAVALIVLDKVLESKRSSFRTPVLGVAVGIYLPLELDMTIGIGGIIAWAVARSLAARRPQLVDGYDGAIQASESRGLLCASGLITGEALVGILLAIPFAAAQSTDVLNLAPEGFNQAALMLGVAGFAFICAWLYRLASKVT